MWPQFLRGTFQNQGSHQLILGGLFVFLPLSYHDQFVCSSQKEKNAIFKFELRQRHNAINAKNTENCDSECIYSFRNQSLKNRTSNSDDVSVLTLEWISYHLVDPVFAIFSQCFCEVIFIGLFLLMFLWSCRGRLHYLLGHPQVSLR